MWFVATTPDPGIRCLLVDPEWSSRDASAAGILVREIPGHPIVGPGPNLEPVPGDRVVQIGERSINSFLDFSAALLDLRRFELPPGGRLADGDPASFHGQLLSGGDKLPPIVERASDEQRYVRVVFSRGERRLAAWLPLES
ncbi:MAG: hypothetical protein EHM42_09765, partial [Planctomycetaceae bacterium]